MTEYIELYDIPLLTRIPKKMILRRTSIQKVLPPYSFNVGLPNEGVAINIYEDDRDGPLTIQAPLSFQEWFWKQYEFLREHLLLASSPEPYEGESNVR